jgi:hypothetical protein
MNKVCPLSAKCPSCKNFILTAKLKKGENGRCRVCDSLINFDGIRFDLIFWSGRTGAKYETPK